MCGRYTLHTEKEALAERFDFDPADLDALAAHYNIAPTQNVPVVRAGEARRVASFMRWGLVPSWAKALTGLPQMINARAEGIADKPSFRTPLRRQRCLIPADGFYEWRRVNGTKEAFLVRRADARPFAFAGLWEPPAERDPGVEGTCTIVTTDPNPVLREIHDRMPVILDPEDWNRWLDPEMHKVSALRALLRPCPAETLTLTRVGPAVNNSSNETPDCAQPA